MIDDDSINEAIRTNISRLRERHPQTESKVTHQVLADAIGIKRATLTNILLGNQRAPVHVIYRVCAFFGVQLTDVLPDIAEVSQTPKKAVIDVGLQQHELPEKATAALEKARQLISN